MLLAIDDVQWLDSSSRAAVEFAIRRLGGPLGVLVTARTDSDRGDGGWLQVSRPDGVARVQVTPMSLGALHGIISERLGRSLPRPTMVRIAEVSGGNPFYALELARGVPTGSGSYDTVLPSTLVDLVRHRTQRFSEDTKGVLLAAACVADPTVELTCAATGLPSTQVVELLEQPEHDGLVSIEGNRVRYATLSWLEAFTPMPVRHSAAECTAHWRTSNRSLSLRRDTLLSGAPAPTRTFCGHSIRPPKRRAAAAPPRPRPN